MDDSTTGVSRRQWLGTAGLVAAASAIGELTTECAHAAPPSGPPSVDPPAATKLPGWLAATEVEENTMPTMVAPDRRLGIAVVGLGRLALQEILPAFASCKFARVTALVTGDATGAKAKTTAEQYGIAADRVYNYTTYEQLANAPDVQAVYIVLPNSLHADFTVRAAKMGKHVLCEKPMAPSSTECQQMIDACAKADRKLMIAYRMQYEPHHRALIKMARAGELGALKVISAENGQNQGDPQQWRQKKALAGGGAMPDVGIYCLSFARYVSGEEPIAIVAQITSTPNDPRFAEVEEQVAFTLRFPSGLLANCTTSYGFHERRRASVLGASAWVEMDPAFGYSGVRLAIGRKSQPIAGEAREIRSDVRIEEKNQFALEIDHFAQAVAKNRQPHTPGEEGLQDVHLMETIYAAASENTVKTLPPVTKLDAFRGPIED